MSVSWYTKTHGDISGPHTEEQIVSLVSRHGDFLELAPARSKTWKKPSETEFAKHIPSEPIEPPQNLGAHSTSQNDSPSTGAPFLAGLIALAAIAGVGVLYVNSDLNAPASNAAQPSTNDQRSIPSEPEPASAVPASPEIRETDAEQETRAARTDALKAGGPAFRLREAKAFASKCIVSNVCDSHEAASLVASAADQKDGALMGAIVGSVMSSMACKQASDGSELSVEAIKRAYEPLLANGKIGLKHLPTCTRGAAAKDPSTERGKVISVSGQVVQIRRDGALYVGNIVSESMKTSYFVTPFSTANIEEGTYATFRGIFVQTYAFENVSGGETQAIALLGAFE